MSDGEAEGREANEAQEGGYEDPGAPVRDEIRAQSPQEVEAGVFVGWSCPCGRRFNSEMSPGWANVFGRGMAMAVSCDKCGTSLAVRAPKKEQPRIVAPNRHERRKLAKILGANGKPLHV